MRKFSEHEIKKLSVEELESASGGYTFDPDPRQGFEQLRTAGRRML